MILKLIKYRTLIFYTLFYLSKYLFIRLLYSNKKFLNYLLTKKKTKLHSLKRVNDKQPLPSINMSINKILYAIYSNGNCLVRCLVKRDLLLKNGIHEDVYLGVNNSNEGLFAHAWMSGEIESKYKVVHLL